MKRSLRTSLKRAQSRRPSSVILWSLVIAFGCASASANVHNMLPSGAVLEVLVVLSALSAARRLRPAILLTAICAATYLAVRALLAVGYAHVPVADFLQSHKWVWYLLLLVVAVSGSGQGRDLGGPSRLLIALAAVKYTGWSLVNGVGSRPGLLVENNFELALFFGLYAIYVENGRPRERWFYLCLLGYCTLLSGSRSGALMYLCLLIYVFLRRGRGRPIYAYAAVLLSAAGAFLVYAIFSARSSAELSLDRVQFLHVFLYETRNWNIGDWIFGSPVLTELSPASCSSLAYYESLLSSAGDGGCFSVILHSFGLRLLFDFGIAGTIAFAVVFLGALRAARVPSSMTLLLGGMIVANSLSVSGPNSPFVFLPVLLAVAFLGRPLGGSPETATDLSLDRKHINQK